MPARAREDVGDARNEVWVSDISIWEIAIKHAKRPDAMPLAASEFARMCEAAGFRRLPLDLDAVLAYEGLDLEDADKVHRDPFDRMLVAQARSANVTLVTHDSKLSLYHEPRVAVYS